MLKLAFEYLEAQMQQMSPDDVVFMRRTMEMPSLRSTLLDQKYINAALNDQLTRSPDIKFISIVQQIEEVSVIHNSAITHTITGAGAHENTRRQRCDERRDILRSDPHGISSDFIRPHIRPPYTQTEHSDSSTRQQTELVTLRSEPFEQRHFISALKQQLTRTTEIRIVHKFEEVSLIHNLTAISGSSGHEEVCSTHVISSNDGQPQPGPPYAHSKQSESPTTWSRNRGNSTAITDSSPQKQPQPGPPFSHSKQTASPTRKNEPRKCSWNLSYSDDKMHHQLPEASLPRSRNVKQSETSTQKKQCRRSNRNKKGDRKECPRRVKSSNDAPETSLSIRQESKTYTCAECNKRFSLKYHLAVHLRIHSGEKPYQCKTCNKDFRQECHLTRHLTIHSGEKQYQCKTCNKDFKQKGDLTRHLRIHSGEKPYQCKTCKRTFSQKNGLTMHVRIHSGEKPYQCKTCNKDFREKGDLTRHLRIHSGEKPYQCKTCKRAFSQKSSLNRHLKTHPGEKPLDL